MKINKQYKIYLILIGILSVVAFFSVFFDQGSFLPSQELPASKSILGLINFLIAMFIYGGLGFLGLKLSEKLGFAKIWDKKISIKKKVWQPIVIGIALGLFFIIVDLIFAKFHGFGTLPHPPFPLSFLASISASIGEEIITRLFFMSFWVWLFYYIIFRKKYLNIIFWIFVIISAIIFTILHIPSIFVIYNIDSISQIPIFLLIELFLLNGSLSIFAAYNFRKYGFLTAVIIHFCTDIVWHVLYGFI